MVIRFISKWLYLFFLVGFLLLVFFGIKLRTGIPFVPIEIYDEYYYLLISVSRGLLSDYGMTNPYYQFFVFIFSRLFNSFSGIVFFQFFLTLIEVFFIFLIFKEIENFYFKKVFLIKRSIFYLISLVFLFIFLFSSSKLRFEYQMRLEAFSSFFEVIFVYLLLKFLNRQTKQKKLSVLIICLSLIAVLFQNKFLFLSLFNIFLVILMNLTTKKSKKKFPIIKIVLILVFLAFFFNKMVTTLVHKTDFHKMLYNSMVFWRNYKIIDDYVIKDIKNPNFFKFDKNLLIDLRKVYISKKYLYELDSGISLNELDFIIYDDSPREVYAKYTNYKKIDFIFKYYFIKSVILSPYSYIKDYFREMKNIFINKNIYIFKPSNTYIQKNEYIEVKEWTRERHGNNILYFNIYLKDLDKIINNYQSIRTIPELTKIELFLNSKYLILVFAALLVILIRRFFKFNLMINLENMVIYIILAPLIMYSVTAVVYLFDERYLAEIFPLFLFSCYFSILSLVILLPDTIKKMIVFYRK